MLFKIKKENKNWIKIKKKCGVEQERCNEVFWRKTCAKNLRRLSEKVVGKSLALSEVNKRYIVLNTN